MSLIARIEAIIYAAEEPVTLAQIFALVKGDIRQELMRRRLATDAQASAPEAPVEIIPAEDDREANLAAAPVETPEPEEPLTESAFADLILPGSPSAIDAEIAAPRETSAAEPPALGDAELKSELRAALQQLIARYSAPEHGIEVRQIAGGYRMATKPEQHDAVRAFARSLKSPVRLSLQALETLAVIAYKQPITAPEISEVRGVDCGGVLGTLLDRKLITTAGRKQVVGRPILYKTTKEFLLNFGLKDVGELPSMEEFEKLAAESLSTDLFAPQASEPETSPAVETTASASEPSPDGATKEIAAIEAPAETAADAAANTGDTDEQEQKAAPESESAGNVQ